MGDRPRSSSYSRSIPPVARDGRETDREKRDRWERCRDRETRDDANDGDDDDDAVDERANARAMPRGDGTARRARAADDANGAQGPGRCDVGCARSRGLSTRGDDGRGRWDDAGD